MIVFVIVIISFTLVYINNNMKRLVCQHCFKSFLISFLSVPLP
uniref:Uncharacterized protein n=1 Tax=Staphylococcus phage 184DA TaxID=3110532 RepID=A0AAU6MXL1_9CAUD